VLTLEWKNEIRKSLMHIEHVLVDLRPWSADAVVLNSGEILAVESHIRSQLRVGMQHVALEYVAVVAVCIARTRASVLIVIKLKALTDFAAERQIPIVTSPERDVLDGVPEIGATRRIAQVAVIFVVSQKLIRRRRLDLGRLG
jgi:hypothetical protein